MVALSGITRPNFSLLSAFFVLVVVGFFFSFLAVLGEDSLYSSVMVLARLPWKDGKMDRWDGYMPSSKFSGIVASNKRIWGGLAMVSSYHSDAKRERGRT